MKVHGAITHSEPGTVEPPKITGGHTLAIFCAFL